MSYKKDWPVWSDRTGQTAIAGATDPYDDAVRLLDYGPTALDDSEIQNYPLATGNAAEVYPVRRNPLCQRARGMDLSPIGLWPRRLNNRMGNVDSIPAGDSEISTLDPSYVDYTNAIADQPLDFNLYNNGYRTWVRVGWNILVSYFHFSGVGSSRSEWLGKSLNNGNQMAPWFLCKDGELRQYNLVMDPDLMDSLEADWWEQDSGPLDWDFAFARFGDGPPSDDLVSIAKVMKTQNHLNLELRGTDNGFVIDPQGRVVPATNTKAGFFIQREINRYNYFFYQEPSAVFDGDSGRNLFTNVSGECMWIANISSKGASESATLTDERLEILNTAIAANPTHHTDGNGKLRTIQSVDRDVLDTPVRSAVTGPIKPKRSETASSVPAASQLADGELAMNLEDEKLFSKKTDGTVVDFTARKVDSVSEGGGSDTVGNIVSMTQSEYDDGAFTPVSDTLYIITGP